MTLLQARGRPFFLVVEAALPDKAAHLNHAKRALIEVLELDAAIEWLRRNLSANTLLLATTDHNNGGFSFNGPPVSALASRRRPPWNAAAAGHELLHLGQRAGF